jgi:hypothetical protein
MMMDLDKKIGVYFHGWTTEETGRNNHYDMWANIWRPKPHDSNGIPTPGFSSSVVEALNLVSHIEATCNITTTITKLHGVWQVDMVDISKKSDEFAHTFYAGESLPLTIARCAITHIERRYKHAGLPLYTPNRFEQDLPSL